MENFINRISQSNRTSSKTLTQREEILHYLTAGAQRFLDTFEAPSTGGKRVARLVANNNLLAINKFPLPDYFKPQDEVDMVIDMRQIPARGVMGFHIVKKGNSETIKIIDRALGGHVFNSDKGIHETYSFEGGVWICLHYAGNSWRFNAKDPEKGDTIAKFLATIFAKLMAFEK